MERISDILMYSSMETKQYSFIFDREIYVCIGLEIFQGIAESSPNFSGPYKAGSILSQLSFVSSLLK